MEKTNIAKQEQIVTAATKLFARHGFRKTSMDEIAKAAKVSKATIYLFFNDKVALLGGVYLGKACQLKEKMSQHLNSEEPTIIRLLKMLNVAQEFCSKDPLFSQLFDQREMEELEAIPQFDQVIAEAVALIEGILSEGIARGEIRPLPVKIAAYFLFRIGFYLSQYGRELFIKYSLAEINELFQMVLTGGIVTPNHQSSNIPQITINM